MAGARRKHPPAKLGQIDPRWQRLLASRRDGFAGVPSIAGPQPPEASSWAAPEPAPPRPAPVSPARAESTTQVTRPPSGGQSDAMHVMATLLVSQLGRDPAWRTAMANAEAQSADSSEHAYWSGVAAAIRDGLRPRQ